VWASGRDPVRTRATAEELGARHVVLDVSDDASVEAAALTVAEAAGGVLDVLINNAGIVGKVSPADEITAADLQQVFEVNVLGVVRAIHAFLPLLDRSQSPVIVNVSSGLGSLALTTGPGSPASQWVLPVYCSSKAALNMLTTQYAKAFPAIRINAVDPGYTATDLNFNTGTQTVGEGTDAIISMATTGSDGPTGTFVSRDGPVAW